MSPELMVDKLWADVFERALVDAATKDRLNRLRAIGDVAPEFECKCSGIQRSTGTECWGCRANRAVANAVLAERERIARECAPLVVDALSAWLFPDGEVPGRRDEMVGIVENRLRNSVA